MDAVITRLAPAGAGQQQEAGRAPTSSLPLVLLIKPGVALRLTLSVVKDDWWILPVVVLADLPHSHQRFEVLVGLVGVDVVQGAAISGIPVGGGEVYCHLRRKRARTRMKERTMTRCRKGWRDKIQNLLWTESGSPPWCNPGRNTFWWSAIGNAERWDWIWEKGASSRRQTHKWLFRTLPTNPSLALFVLFSSGFDARGTHTHTTKVAED